MKNIFYSTIFGLLFLFPFSSLYATSLFSHETTQYILRITAYNPKKIVPFIGSYVVTGKNGNRVISFLFGKKPMASLNTPYETRVNVPWEVTAISALIVATDTHQNENIKFSLIKKTAEKEDTMITGEGHTLVTTSDLNLLMNNLYSK